jgi:hypothetical protein
VQRAGPDLTAANVQRGLESLSRPSPGPTSPAASYSIGDHAFIDDYVLGVFSPTAQTPGGADPESEGTGCYVLPDGGPRRTAGGWPPNDYSGDSGVCAADPTNHTNTSADSGGTPGPGF